MRARLYDQKISIRIKISFLKHLNSDNRWSTSRLTVRRVGSSCQKVSASFVQSIGFLQPPYRTVGRSEPNDSHMYLCVDWSSIHYIKKIIHSIKDRSQMRKNSVHSNIATRIRNRCENRKTYCLLMSACPVVSREKNRVDKKRNGSLERGK